MTRMYIIPTTNFRRLMLSVVAAGMFTASCNGPTNPPEANHSAHQGPVSTDLMLSETQMKLANITTRPVRKKPIGQSVIINGKLVADEERARVISSRAEGRIEKLHLKETGQTIHEGEPLYVLYSESLLTLQQEYLLAREQFQAFGQTEKRYGSFLEAAERKLLLYGLSRNQIEQLNRVSSLAPRITFLAPASGVITEINVSEGQYVTEGAALYRLEDIRTIWVEAELYPREANLVRVGDRIAVTTGGNDEPTEAVISFMSPEFRANTQITIIRASIRNPGLKLKPGQPANVHLTHSAKRAIAVPADAVIRDGKGAHVYIRSAPNTFTPRMVKTGIEGFEDIEITEGLSEGDTVVVTGAYLLYSEVILKHGVDPMTGHGH